MTFYRNCGKRFLDLVASAAGLILCSPLLLAIALAIKLGSPGPVFFRQDRVGQLGKPFKILKFRSMCDGADRMGPGITVSHDSRVTPVGRILRKLKFDELPQLWNVLVGDMSLVGPRPELPEYVRDYTPLQQEVLDLRPGVTDPASIEYRNEEEVLRASSDPHRLYREVILPHKLSLSLVYREKVSFRYDLVLIARTMFRLFHLNPQDRHTLPK
jgi:lipopolysaccharide/colanic/teichoic acid biosynthesis glycosyltransferase